MGISKNHRRSVMVCLPGHATFPVTINTDYSTTPNLDHTKKKRWVFEDSHGDVDGWTAQLGSWIPMQSSVIFPIKLWKLSFFGKPMFKQSQPINPSEPLSAPVLYMSRRRGLRAAHASHGLRSEFCIDSHSQGFKARKTGLSCLRCWFPHNSHAYPYSVPFGNSTKLWKPRPTIITIVFFLYT